MDFCDEILDQNDRYAFLLGSALRNQDHEQFLEIYDRIIPKDIESKEVEVIKERARHLAAVPEEEFATVAVHARDYSLAQPKCTSYVMYDDNTTEELSKIESMRGTASVSSISSLNSDFPSELCPMDNNKPDLSSLMRTSRHFGPQSEAEFSISDASDSGICLNSSIKQGSVSDSEENERPGVFDYVQSRPEPKVEIINVKTFSDSARRNLPKNNTGLSSKSGGKITVHNERYFESDNEDDDFGGNRSDDSGTTYNRSKAKFEQEIEMVKIHRDCESPDCESQVLLCSQGQKIQRKEARTKNNQMYDEAFTVDESNSHESFSQDSSSDQELKQVVVDSDDVVDLDGVSVHRRLYDGGQHNAYLSMNRDFSEDYIEDEDDNERQMRALQRLDEKRPYGSYEKELHFRTHNNYGTIDHNRRSMYGVKGAVDSSVNFGLSRASHNVKVEKSVSKVKTSQPPFGDPINMGKIGEANNKLLRAKFTDTYEIRNMPEAEAIDKHDSKKKKKKKKKEESEEKSIHDINGNPLEEGRAKSSSNQIDSLSQPTSGFPSSLRELGSNYYSPIINHEEIMPSVDQKYHEKKARKNKKKEQEGKKVITSDKIPGHRGGEKLDNLLDFIEGQKVQKKQLKKEQPSPIQQQQSLSVSSFLEEKASEPTIDSASSVVNIKQEKLKKKKISKENSMDNFKDNLSDGSSVSDIKEVTMGPNGPIETVSTSATFTINAENHVITEQKHYSNHSNHGADENHSIVNSTPTSVNYIFTDFDSIPKPATEAAFQTVSSKKKKKNKEPDVRINGTIKNNFQSGGDLNNKRLGSGAREYVNNFRQRQLNNRYTTEKRSYTPPPTPSNIETKPNERAFSPSAFPALGKNSSGRRYSTGDTKEIEVEKEVDSDIESCKSVPAAKTERLVKVADNLPALNSLPAGIRPLPVVSYAKVVGGPPQPPNQQIKASSMDDPSSDEIRPTYDDSDSVDSTKERRHSMGNMPMPEPTHLDGFTKGVTRSQELENGERTSTSGTSSMSTSSKASSLSNSKYGSTENLLVRENSPNADETSLHLNPSSDTDFPPISCSQMQHPPSDNNSSHVIQNISSTTSNTTNSSSDIVNKWSSPPSLVSSQITTQPSSDHVSIQQNNMHNTQDSGNTVARANILNNCKQSTKTELSTNNKVVHSKNIINSSLSNLNEEQKRSRTPQSSNKVASSSVKSSSSSNNNVKAGQQTVNNINSKQQSQRKVPPVNSAKPPSSKTTQSVIFLDRKFSEQTPNLGISFGFEPDLEFDVSNSSDLDNSSNYDSNCNNFIPSASGPTNEGTHKNVINNFKTEVAEANLTKQALPASNVIDIQPQGARKEPSSSQSEGKSSHPPNGIILPKKIDSSSMDRIAAQSNQVIASLPNDNNDNRVCYTIEQNNSDSGITFSAEIVLTSSTTPQDNCTIYATNRNTFTSCEATVSDTGITCSTTSSYVWPKLPSREQDPNYQRGRYDQEKVVGYLYNEWCNVMQDGEKVCDGVAVYGRDLN